MNGWASDLLERTQREDAITYHQRRAEEELAIAQRADNLESRRFHYHLAALHLDRVHREHRGAELKRVA